MVDCEDLIRPALSGTIGQYRIEPGGQHCTVVTPFQQPNGDLITLHVQHDRAEYFLIRDYGETFAMLQLYGVDPTSEAQERDLERIQGQFDLESYAGEIKLRARESELGNRILDSVQAIQAVSSLIYKHSRQPPRQFKTIVGDFIEEAGYEYSTDFTVKGETHERMFDIAINHREPEVLLDTIHAGNVTILRQQVDSVMLNWHEIQGRDYSHGAVVDDVDGRDDSEVVEQLVVNLDYFFRWSDQSEITEKIPLGP